MIMEATMTELEARIAGPASEAIRNTVKQMLALASEDKLSLMQLQLGCGVFMDCADQVELLEAMTVPESQKAAMADVESGKVLLFEKCKGLAIGGAISAPPRRRGLWKRFQTYLRRF
jgi:hypothetical protein